MLKNYLVKMSNGEKETSERVRATTKTGAWMKVTGKQEKSGFASFATSLLRDMGWKITSIEREHRQNEE